MRRVAPFAGIKGMNRDLAASKFNSEFAYEIKNMRIMPNKENTLMALVNEIGTQYSKVELKGTPVGQAVLDGTLVIFTTTKIEDVEDSEKNTESIDRIYKIQFIDGELKIVNPLEETNSEYKDKPIYEGFLNFDMKHPLETIVFYENEDLQKVYWVDGKNQPRVINIAADAEEITKWENNLYQDSFNLIREMDLTEIVTITRTEVANGLFHSGVIQYVFTYFDKYMQETNPFYTSPLYYTSYDNRGASPEDTVSNGFKIEISNADRRFDYIRIYSILRTSDDAEPTCKMVADVGINVDENDNVEDIVYTDLGTTGSTADPTELLYLGGEDITAGTLEQKDNTLFFGDIKLNTTPLYDVEVVTDEKDENGEDKKINFSDYVDKWVKDDKDNTLLTFKIDSDGDNDGIDFTTTSLRVLETPAPTGTYPYKNLLKLSSNEITTFKCGNTYRFGIQAQYKTGRWSDVVWLGDFANDKYPEHKANGHIYLPYAELTIDNKEGNDIAIEALVNAGFVKLRPVMAISNLSDRDCVCQGVLCPTVYNIGDRYENGPFAQSSWFTRPNAPDQKDVTWINPSAVYYKMGEVPVVDENGNPVYDDEGNPVMTDSPSSALIGEAISTVNKGEWAEFRHNHPIPNCYNRNSEIQSIITPPDSPRVSIDTNTEDWINSLSENFFIDQSIVTMHSPDIEFNMDLRGMDTENLKLRIVGTVPVTAFASAIDIQTSTPALTYDGTTDVAVGFYKETVGADHNYPEYGWRALMSAPMWIDTDYNSKKNIGDSDTFSYVVYPWHRNGSLNNQSAADENGYTSAMLDKKRMSNHRVSYRSLFKEEGERSTAWNYDLTGVAIFDSNEMTMLRIPAPRDSVIPDINYYGNIDKVLTMGRDAHIHLPTSNTYANLENSNNKGKDETDENKTRITLDVLTLKDANNNTEDGNAPQGACMYHNYSTSSGDIRKSKGYPIVVSCDDNTTSKAGQAFVAHSAFMAYYFEKWWGNRDATSYAFTAADPIRIKYKSTPHAVIALQHDEGNTVILPTITGINNVSEGSKDVKGMKYFWDKSDDNKSSDSELVTQKEIDADICGVNDYDGTVAEKDKVKCGFLWLAELYRNVDDTTMYGGKTEEALENNIWIAAGEPVLIAEPDGEGGRTPVDGDIVLRWTQGDTYYMRYDHIKTYPYTTEDQNSVTDIISFMCETRINLDGRYDRNRGQVDNLSITPENFNLMNDVYNQANDFFTFNYLNSKKINLDNFRNVITWTKTKTAGDLVDTWTNITVASTLDLDGDKGNVNKLKRFNNDLLAFQDTGISQILYNETMQIASTEGVPIEIANSGKVQGKRYLANQAGCINKWSMCETPAGLYFIDDINKTMYLFNGQFGKLSEQFGFTSWINSQLGSMEAWNPIDFNNFVTYYDKCNHDIYFINKDYCLAFSESLGQFTSFYDYNAIPYFANFQDRGIWMQNIITEGSEEDKYSCKLWMHNEGQYNSFFDESGEIFNPYWLTIVANPEMQMDKVFDNIEFRSDTYSDDLGLLHSRTFDTLRAYNEYQDTGEVPLKNIWAKPSSTSNLKKKFRVWRAIIPRDKNGNGRNRIRNPWTYLTLKMNDPQNYKTILHDLIVYYFDSLPNSSNNGNSNGE